MLFVFTLLGGKSLAYFVKPNTKQRTRQSLSLESEDVYGLRFQIAASQFRVIGIATVRAERFQNLYRP